MIAPPILLSKTAADFTKLSQLGKDVLGHSVNRNIDAKAIKNPIIKYLSMLSEALDEKSNSDDVLSNIGLLADQYHITLALIVEDIIYEDLLHYRMLNIIGAETLKRGIKLMIVSASLRGWRDSVIDGTLESVGSDTRDVFNNIYSLFITEELGRLWFNYSKKRHTDGTIILIEK